MNVLILGKGKGSYEMRGLQLGAAIGARVTTQPSRDDWSWAEIVVCLKRWTQHAQEAHLRGLPVVWDALDFWSQPLQNGATETVARQMLANQIKAIRPSLVIGATKAMASACGGVYLPHHSWHGLKPTEPRPIVQTVGYEGSERYLGRWASKISSLCARRGWQFVINPSRLSMVDIVIALRDEPWDGWMCREWKSGVKLVNAMAAGRPVITQLGAAVYEIMPPGMSVEVTPIDQAFDYWSEFTHRYKAYEDCCERAGQYRLAAVAERYLGLFETVRASCAA